jgi:uncharacterized membrane protein YeaQ/YmgE (transglycosylase-associated protein family)
MWEKFWGKVEPVVERKVVAQSTTTAVVGAVIWVLHKNGINFDQAEQLVQWVVPAVLGAVAGYLAKHTVKPVDAPVK